MNGLKIWKASKIGYLLCLYLFLSVSAVFAEAGSEVKLKPGEARRGLWQLDSTFCQLWPMNWLGQKDYVLFSELAELPQSWVKSAYFKEPKTNRVYDPQDYLSAIEEDVIVDLLKNHSSLSQLPMSVYIFGNGQRVGKLTPQAVCEHFFADENAVVMFYFIDDPRATQGFMKLNKSLKTKELDEFLVKTLFVKAGAHADSLQVDEKEAMYATIADVSQRMYWIENDLGIVKQSAVVVDDYKEKVVEKEPSMMDKLWGHFGGSKENLAYFTGGVIIATLLILFAIVLQIFRRVKVYRFPEYKGARRLGGEYGAGIGEVLAFSDPKQSLLEQKKQIKDSEL